MSESEWLNSHKSLDMLDVVSKRMSVRKRRLFACACCRRMVERLLVWQPNPALQPDLHTPQVLEIIERYADGGARKREQKGEVSAALRAAQKAFEVSRQKNGISSSIERRGYEACRGAAEGNAKLTADNAIRVRASAVEHVEGEEENDEEAYWRPWNEADAEQAAILRDVVGNPFHPSTVDPEWLTSTVVTLVKQMYDSSDFSAMPVLADALQDAGCDNEEVLHHCREPGLHVRGCWVVDLILSKA